MALAPAHGMTKLVAAGVALATVTVAAQQPPGRPSSTPPARAQAAVVASARHDTSAPLRRIPPVPPARRLDPDEREPRLARRIVRGRGAPDPVVQRTRGAMVMPATSQSLEGIGNVNDVLPPDTNAAVGPDHYVHSVNVSFAVYSKGSASAPPELLYGPAETSTLWAGFGGPCEGRNDGDAIVLYDHLADRWVMSQLALPNLIFGIPLGPFYQCLAVSATSDPLGAYHRYEFAFDKLNDYPKLGVWPDAYYLAINQFSAGTLQFAGQGVIAFDRVRMLAGLPATMQYLDLASVDMNLAGMLPADLDGPAPPPGSPGYFVQMDDDAWGYSEDRLQLWRFHVDWTAPSATRFEGPSLIPVAPFDTNMCDYSRTCIPQRGTEARVDAMADRMMYRLQYRNFGSHESLVVNHTVDADGADHAGIRWYEIRGPLTSPVLHQQGTYAPDADHRWMGSLAMDSAGNLALGFSVSGTSTFPSVRYTGRLAADAPGAMTQGESEVIAGSGAQTHPSGRWGDYSMMAVDPVDDCTFWYTQQYYADTTAAGWRTRIGTFSFPSCTPPPDLPRVSVMATTPEAHEAGEVPGIFTVSRTGDTSEAIDVAYVVGGTAQPGADYAPLTGQVTLSAGAASATITVAPVDDPYAEPDEVVSVTLAAGAGYLLGASSQAVVAILSDDLPPDLVVAAVTAPATALPGGSITISDTTRNQGAGTAESSTTGLYLSKNVLLDASDILLGTRAVNALAAGASETGSSSVTIPAGTETGTYYVIARADHTGTLPETNEYNNNRFSTLVRVGPDLVVPAFGAAPSVSGAGGTVTLTDTTRNQGTMPVGATVTAYYFSSNAILDTGDERIGSRSVPALSPDGASTGSTAVQLPQSAGIGTYYLFARADDQGAVVESTETNNASRLFAIRLGPDLVVSAVKAPYTAPAGSTITVADTTTNSGGASAPGSTTRFYLSVNLGFDASDVALGSRSVGALAAGASSAGSTPVVIPAATTPGSYWLIAVTDADGGVTEASETNNTKVVFVRVTVGG
jgi:hypothetical protein